MALLTQVLDDVKTAMKSGEKLKLETLRFLHAKIKDLAINQRKEIEDGDVLSVCMANIKSRQDAIEQYRAGGREDLVKKEEQEIAWIRAYLPAEMSDAELEKTIREAIQATGAAGPKEMGKVMAALMPKVKGRADGKKVNEMVKKLLGS